MIGSTSIYAYFCTLKCIRGLKGGMHLGESKTIFKQSKVLCTVISSQAQQL